MATENRNNVPRGRALSRAPAEIERAATVTRDDFESARRAWMKDVGNVPIAHIVDARREDAATS